MEPSWKPSHVVFCHSASSLALTIEVIRAFEARQVFSHAVCYASSGNGALLSLMKYLGYSATEMERLLAPHYKELARDAFANKRLTDRRLLLLSIIADIFQDLTIGIPSLHQLYLLTGKKLYFTSYNVTKAEVVYLSVDTHPEMSTADALLLSMSEATIDGESYLDACSVAPVACLPGQKKTLVVQTYPGGDLFSSRKQILHQAAVKQLAFAQFRATKGVNLYFRLEYHAFNGLTDEVERRVEKALEKITKANKKILYSKELFE